MFGAGVEIITETDEHILYRISAIVGDEHHEWWVTVEKEP